MDGRNPHINHRFFWSVDQLRSVLSPFSRTQRQFSWYGARFSFSFVSLPSTVKKHLLSSTKPRKRPSLTVISSCLSANLASALIRRRQQLRTSLPLDAADDAADFSDKLSLGHSHVGGGKLDVEDDEDGVVFMKLLFSSDG